jgi:hypothetical protein
MQELISSVTTEHLIFVFALIFIFTFKKPLMGLIERTEKIGKDGLTVGNNSKIQENSSQSTSESVQTLLDYVGNSIVINKLETNIVKDLKDKNLDSSGDTAKVLIKHLAGTQALLAFERIYSNIFGSQIQLLKRLNEQSRDNEYVLQHYNQICEKVPNFKDSITYDIYNNFLISNILIIKEDDSFLVTNMGIEFLTWLTRNGKLEGKQL